MSFTDILIILGCVAAGYWIVSSVMGPGIDITRQQKPADKEVRRDEPRAEPRHAAPQPQPSAPRPRPPSFPQRALPQAAPPGPAIPRPALPRPSTASRPQGMPDWYLVLDVLQSASRTEIEAAFLRQQKKAQADRDSLLLERLKRARDAGIAHVRHAATH